METTFRFVGYAFAPKQGSATFSYELETEEKKYRFTELLSFPKISDISGKEQSIKKSLEALLLMLGISYYKLTCAKTIEIVPFTLSDTQAQFWNTVYTKGLGEFFYINKIDFRGLINFPCDESVIARRNDEAISSETSQDRHINDRNDARSLVLFGGGKDSVVSTQLLKKNKKDFDLFIVDESSLQQEAAEKIDAGKVVFTRTLDQQLFTLNKEKGMLNGHIPISAVWAFLGVFAAMLFDYKYVITSNEASSNYGNVEYLEEEINHQWSKTLEFEKLFSFYIQAHVTKNVQYFSLLRPLHEIKIAQIFSDSPQFFYHFSSCNRNFTITNKLSGTKWCGRCPKCLFAFIILAPFVEKHTLVDFFGKNMFEDLSLTQLLRELLGIDGFKPFECVGTPEETKLALLLVSQKEEYKYDPLISIFLQSFSMTTQEIEKLQEDILSAKLPACLPHEFARIINSL